MKEVVNEVGTLGDFLDMNVLQQEALAKAAGTTVDELANELISRTSINELKQIGTTNSRDAEHTTNRMIGHLEDMQRSMGLPSLEKRTIADPIYTGQLETSNKDILILL